MQDERKHIYLEKIMKKVPIHAEAGTYTWKIDITSNRISEETERLLVYALYVGHPDYNFFELAKNNLPKKVFGDSSPELIRSSFKDDHPLIDITEYDYDMVEAFADPVKGMWIYGDKKQNFWITLEDEKVLLSRLKDVTPWNNCKSYLRNIPARYDMTFDDKAIETALSCFLCQHGIDHEKVKGKDYEWKVTRKQLSSNTSIENNQHKDEHNNPTGVWQKRPIEEDNAFFIPRLGVSRIISVVFIAIIIGLWIAIFSNIVIPFWIIPALTILVGVNAIANDPDMGTRHNWFGLYIIFYILNCITSFLAFGAHWKWELMDNNWCAFLTLIISIGFFLLSFGIVSDGRHLIHYDKESGRWRRLKDKN
jgi:hypothetical protein